MSTGRIKSKENHRETLPKSRSSSPSLAAVESDRSDREVTAANSLDISKPKYDPEHPAAHLRDHQFKPGVSGSPSGRPKGIFGAAVLKRLLLYGKDGESKLLALTDAQIDEAIRKRDTRATEFLRESVDGRPTANDDSHHNVEGVTIIWGGDPPLWALPATVILYQGALLVRL